jgi:hypothetical protein
VKLFAIYIGGEHPGAHIEVHDVRFVAAERIEDTYDRLRADWWGTPGTLHVDCWAEIDHADGFDVRLRPGRPSGDEKLYFVNLGGYDGREFAEQHRNLFVVASSVSQAKARALDGVSGWADAHRDDLYEADQVFELNDMIGDRLHIHLERAAEQRPPRFTCRYTPLK